MVLVMGKCITRKLSQTLPSCHFPALLWTFGIKAMLLFIYTIILIVLEPSSSSAQDCLGPSRAPEIEVTRIGLGWERFPCRQHVVELNEESGVSRMYIECKHSNPVQWVLDINPSRDQFRFTRSFLQRRNATSSHYHYSDYLVLIYKQDQMKDTLLMCQNACGGRNYLEISPQLYTTSTRVTDNPTTPQFALLADKLRNTTTVPTTATECPMVLTIKVTYDGEKKHGLQYKWTTQDNHTQISEEYSLSSSTTTDQGIYFRNIFRTLPQERNCVKKLGPDEICEDCSEVVREDEEDAVINSAAFFAQTDSMRSMGFKGIFSITTPRNFYFGWEVPPPEMVDFDPPPIVYVGQVIQLRCNVSTIYFAYGTTIFSEQVDLHVTTNINCSSAANFGETETWSPDGKRVVDKGVQFLEGNMTIDLTCSAPLWDWSQRVNKTKQIFIDYPVAPQIDPNNSSSVEDIVVEGTERNVSFTCGGYGRPRPLLKWLAPNKDIMENVYIQDTSPVDEPYRTYSTLTLLSLSRDNLGTYNCILSNDFGNISKSFHLKILPHGLSTAAKAGISSGLGVLIILGCTVTMLIYRRILLNRKIYRTKTAAAIKEFKEGMKKAQQKEKEAFHYKTMQFEGDERPQPHASILELPYNDCFEVDREKWEVGDIFLGEGTFGFVRKGVVKISAEQRHTVAIKMLRNLVEIDDFKNFLTELKIMAYIGKHQNVVSLVAACTENIDQRDVMIGVEFCSNGSLQDYLQDKRFMFQTDNPQVTLESSGKTYSNMSNTVALTELDLYTWSYQIANGMEFLASKQVLHGDLATRNVLLTLDKMAKISDFGLSRVLLDSKNYTKKSRVPLPWKWMSIEALTALKFSTASDVWAYGVTLWEIFSLGEVPYAGLSYGVEFLQKLNNGFRLAKPSLATDYVHNIMRHCWTHEAECRVNFSQLKSAFSELLDIFTSPALGGGSPLPMSRKVASMTTNFSLRHSSVAQPRRNRAPEEEDSSPWYSNRPTQVPNLYFNV